MRLFGVPRRQLADQHGTTAGVRSAGARSHASHEGSGKKGRKQAGGLLTVGRRCRCGRDERIGEEVEESAAVHPCSASVTTSSRTAFPFSRVAPSWCAPASAGRRGGDAPPSSPLSPPSPPLPPRWQNSEKGKIPQVALRVSEGLATGFCACVGSR
jgi:hypothetical protein